VVAFVQGAEKAQLRRQRVNEPGKSCHAQCPPFLSQLPAINIRKLPAITVSATRNTVPTYVRKNNQKIINKVFIQTSVEDKFDDFACSDRRRPRHSGI
jgi:hypothetical protein